MSVVARAAVRRPPGSVPASEDIPVQRLAALEPDRNTRAPTAFELALCDALAPDADVDPSSLRQTAQFLVEQLDALPTTLTVPFRAGMTMFSCYVLVRHGQRFANLDRERRRAALHAWAFGPVPLLRQLFRPVRSIALLAHYEQ